MDIALIVFPGTNREHDMAFALQQASGVMPRLVWHKDTDLGKPDLIVLPGGFSYGDYLRCGAMAAHSPIMKDVISQAGRGTRIFGVCNGFQILVETGLLPGALLQNNSLKFVCRQVNLRCEHPGQDFTRFMSAGEQMRIPVAHGEGNYFAPPEMIRQMEDNGLIAFRYCNDNGAMDDDSNPNGSVGHIAGIYNAQKNILGMMPHPENATLDHQANTSARSFFKGLIHNL